MLLRVLILSILTLLLSVAAYADQAAYVEKEVATRAVSILKGVTKIAHLCEPCREANPSVEDIKQVDMTGPSDGLWSVRVNGKGVDLAYVFYPTANGRWRNLGLEVKADVDGVSAFISVDSARNASPNGNSAPAKTKTSNAGQINEIARLRELASKAFDEKDYRTAAKHYTSIIAIDPNDAQAYVGRGASAGMAKREEDANIDYNTAISVVTKKINAGERTSRNYGLRAVVYSNKQEYGASLADYDLAIQAGPNLADLYYDRARVLEFLGDKDRAKADRRKYTELGGTLPTPQPVRAMFPRATFDIEAARAAMARGDGSIEGIVCTNLKSGVYRAAGVRVSLFPATPYLDEWYKLREKKESKDMGVFMSWEANYHRKDVTANEEGRFVFYDLKPGRYFIQTFHDFSTAHSANVFVGSDSNTDYYQTERWTQGHSKRIEKFVDVKADGATVKVTMKKGNPLSLRGCL